MADQILPPLLARECGFQHIKFRKQHHFRDRWDLVRDHNANHLSAGDAEHFIKGIRDEMIGLSFGGHGFAVASGFALLHHLPNTLIQAETTAQQLAHHFQEPSDSTAVLGLKAWLEWILKYPQAHLDWRDRFFIEQRQAGWLSTKEQLYDLNSLERFPILNSARNYAILLGVCPSQRLGSQLQQASISQLMPGLLKYPFNPKDISFWQLLAWPSWDHSAYLVKKVVRKLRGA